MALEKETAEAETEEDAQAVATVEETAEAETEEEACTSSRSRCASRRTHTRCHSTQTPPPHGTGACPAHGTRATPRSTSHPTTNPTSET